MKPWTLDDIPWSRFEPDKVDPAQLPILKAASILEYGVVATLVRRMRSLFHDDPVLLDMASRWADDETRHGQALGRWLRLTDSSFDVEAATAAAATVRATREAPPDDAKVKQGSRAGELIGRCLTETVTCSYWSAMAETSQEPVLRDICRRIAADEFVHYKMFYSQVARYLGTERMGPLRRLMVAARHIMGTEDDELAYAYYGANESGRAYQHARENAAFSLGVYSALRRHHVDRGVAMTFKAAGLNPQGRFQRLAARLAWWGTRRRVQSLRRLTA